MGSSSSWSRKATVVAEIAMGCAWGRIDETYRETEPGDSAIAHAPLQMAGAVGGDGRVVMVS